MTKKKESPTTELGIGSTYVWAEPGRPAVRGKVIKETSTAVGFKWEKPGFKSIHHKPLNKFFFKEGVDA